MKNVVFILFYYLFFQTQSLFSLNFEFINFPVTKFDKQISYLASQNQSNIYISDNNIFIIAKDSIIFNFNFDEKIKIEPNCISNFTIFFYYNFLNKHKYEVYKELSIKNSSNQIVGKIEILNSKLKIYYKNIYKHYNFTTKEKSESDPQLNSSSLIWSSLIGGSQNDYFATINVDLNKSIIVSGITSSNALADLLPINFTRGNADFVVAKFNSDLTISWVALAGGSGNDYCHSATLDQNNDIWLCGETNSNNFYVTTNTIQKSNNGGAADCAAVKLSKDGIILFSTYMGGQGYESFVDVCVDKNNDAWFTGRTQSADFPLTGDASDKSLNELYKSPIVKISGSGNLIYSSYYGGSTSGKLTLADCIASDSNDNIIIAGYSNSSNIPLGTGNYQLSNNGLYDSFIAKFNSSANLLWGTYIGGVSNDYGSSLVIDNEDNIILNSYVASIGNNVFNSTLQPNNKGALDNYLTKFDPNGILLWSTYLGGQNKEGEDYGALNKIGGNVCVNSKNDIFLICRTNSTNINTTDDAYSKNLIGDYDAFIAILDKNSELRYATYFGGSGYDNVGDIALLNDSSFVITGHTRSNNFPLINSYKTNRDLSFSDGFIALFGIQLSKPSLPFISFYETNECHTYWFYEISDTSATNPGMKSGYNVELQDNCDFSVTSSGGKIFVKITVIDIEKAAAFKIAFQSNSGKNIIIQNSRGPGGETFFGFSPNDFLDFGSVQYSLGSIRKLKIYNLSDSIRTIDNLQLLFNNDFSIPQSQLPINILPHDSVEIDFYFSPLNIEYGVLSDTLIIENGCGITKIPLAGELIHSVYNTNSKCDVQLSATTTDNIIIQAPSIEQVFSYKDLITVNVRNISIRTEITLFDFLGRMVRSDLITAGKENFDIPTSDLVPGIYFVRLNNSYGTSQVKVLIY